LSETTLASRNRPGPRDLALMRAAHFPQRLFDPFPSPSLLLIPGLPKGLGLVSGFCDGFGALRCKEVVRDGALPDSRTRLGLARN